MENAITILQIVVWPLTVCILTLCIRRTIINFFEILTEKARQGDAEISHGSTRILLKAAALTPEEELQFSNAPWQKRFANLFWLASDLRFTAVALEAGKPISAVRKGLEQSAHHLSQIELQHSTPGRTILQLRDALEETEIVSREQARKIAAKVLEALRQFGHMASSHQPGFNDGLEQQPK